MHPVLAAALLSLPTTHVAAETRVVRIASKILGEERVVHVSLPPNYSVARRRYETTYLLDGHVRQFFDITVAAAGYDIVGDAHDYATPPQIVVGVDQIDRGADLGRNQELFTRFLVEELVPYIDREFRTNRYRTLIGHSLGGRFALMTFCRAPGVFPAVIAISAAGSVDSTNADAVTRCLTSAFASPGIALRQLVLSAGDKEPRVFAGMERLRDYLRANAPPYWRWTTIEGTGLGHTDTPMATIPPGIRFIHDKSVWEMSPELGDSVASGRIADPERAVDAFYSAVGARVGVPVTPSLKWMLTSTRVLIQRNDAAAAERSIRRILDAYPEDLEAYGMASDLAVQRADTTTARRALNDALRMLGRLDFYDVYERDRKRKLLERTLTTLGGR